MNSGLISIPEQFRLTARAHADRDLVVTQQQNHSFSEIDAASDRIAAALARQGIGKSDRIALYCINCAEFLMAWHGIVKSGATVVPVNLLIAADEICYILGDAEVSGIIYHQAMAEKVSTFRDRLNGISLWAAIGEPQSESDQTLSTWLAESSVTPAVSFDPLDDVAVILYTSGTTGNPKGAMLSHHNLVSYTSSVCAGLQLKPGEDRLLVVLPMFHSFAATVGMLTPSLHGLSLVPVPAFDPILISETIAATDATIFLGVPSMYGVILRLPEEQTANWSSIRYGVSGGAAMPVELMHQFEARFGFPILEGDGPTECSPVTCVNPLDGERKPGSVGLPIPGVEMAIFDPRGGVLANNEIGEVCVRGDNVMKGYWKLPHDTAESFYGEWVRTGDLGYRDEDGYFFLIDRIKDMIIVNGMNVYPRMIEEVLYKHPDLAEAAVVGEPHATHGEIVVAHVVAKDGCSTASSVIRAFCREHLGQHQVPRKVIIRDSLPKNATGKILKRELRKTGEVERGIK
ncbi:long-chain-fatty-acid--CoA ligase [Solemya velum gill symbiont]|uniref:long-chain-fatty-acid--CoA ligase n=1 Tax=Solemya velum gill symbiont TaxID=2340 RepID=UPI0009984D58|nr:long-chain fatty acid--CoA ligase [Solemya velum gill symbiont]OOY45246.1 long-chain fatty acid--CoA ligase [Solemya velum gill symbiont]